MGRSRCVGDGEEVYFKSAIAGFARESLSKHLRIAGDRGYSLREMINSSFDRVRVIGEGVLFEFGPSRQQNLALHSRILGWQPQLRILFLTRIALWRYRLQLPGFELPKSVALNSTTVPPNCWMLWLTGWREDHRRERIISKIRSSVWTGRFESIRETRTKLSQLSLAHF